MSGHEIAAEIAQALREASAEVGDGTPLIARLTKVAVGGTPWDAATQPTTELFAIVLSQYDAAHVDGDMIRADDWKVTAQSNTLSPEPGDILAWQGQDYRVISVKTEAPGGVPLIHEVQCRK